MRIVACSSCGARKQDAALSYETHHTRMKSCERHNIIIRSLPAADNAVGVTSFERG